MPCRSWFPRRSPQAEGRRAESGALRFLRLRGLRLICRNYRTRGGEIDLIMRDGATCVFVEVRFRSDHRFGSGADSIDAAKRHRLIATARHFVAHHRETAGAECRFDVVSVARRHYRRQYRWIRDAFHP